MYCAIGMSVRESYVPGAEEGSWPTKTFANRYNILWTEACSLLFVGTLTRVPSRG